MTKEKQVETVQLTSVARLLVLAGGIILLAAGLIGAAGGNVSAFVNSPFGGFGRLEEGLLGIVAGLLSLVSLPQLKNVGWAVVLVFLGILAGGFGGILVLIGGFVSLVSIFVKV